MTTHDDRRSSCGTGPSPPLCPSRHPPQSVAACLSIAARRILSHGHQVARDHLRRIGPGGGRAGDGSTQGSRPARLRGVEQAHARLSGTGAAVADAGRRDQRRVWLSRSEMPWLQHAPDRCPRHRAATEGNAGPRTGTLHALPDCSEVRGYPYKRSHLVALRATKITRERSAVDMVAGRAVRRQAYEVRQR